MAPKTATPPSEPPTAPPITAALDDGGELAAVVVVEAVGNVVVVDISVVEEIGTLVSNGKRREPSEQQSPEGLQQYWPKEHCLTSTHELDWTVLC